MTRLLLPYDPQIYGVEQKIIAIRNMFILANMLPPEILSRVLEYRTRERDLVAATYVRRRSTRISDPSLEFPV